MIACIAYRGNAAITAPSGWSTVATAQNSGDTDATNGIASGVMFWIIRGASAPDLTCVRTAGDVVQARVISYSGATGTPYDTGSSNTRAAVAAECFTSTITTAEANELIVAMASGGDNYTLSSGNGYYAATDPATTSGTTPDTTTAPTAGAWLLRHISGTGTGADSTLTIGDAIRATAGATGDIFVGNFSANGRGVMVAGAFKMATGGVVSPTVTTQAATNVTSTSFTGNGNITDTGGENPNVRGVCYMLGTAGDPTTANSTASDSGSFGTGAYTKDVTGLLAGERYRVRAYATNSAGTSYGSTVQVDLTQSGFLAFFE